MRIDEKFDLDKLFFTSDLHFHHANILEYCHRPFKDVEDMNEQLIYNWNNVVPEDGNVFMAGDFIHTGPNSTSSEKAPFHPLRIDVGVDNSNYKPISYQEVKDIINKQKEL